MAYVDGKDCHATYLYGSQAHAGRYPLAQLHATAKMIEDMQRTGSMEEFEEMKRRSSEDVEELLGVSLMHAFTSLLPLFLYEIKK